MKNEHSAKNTKVMQNVETVRALSYIKAMKNVDKECEDVVKLRSRMDCHVTNHIMEEIS